MKAAIFGERLPFCNSIIPALTLFSTLSVCTVYGQENRITKAVNSIDLTSRRYQPRDLDGDGKKDTMCNWYVADIARKLGHGTSAIPVTDQPDPDYTKEFKARSANELYKYFRNEAKKSNGNWKVLEYSQAGAAANRGEFVLASKSRPRGHGHVAVVVPSSTGDQVRVAQAGSKNSKDTPIKFEDGFAFFVYKGK